MKEWFKNAAQVIRNIKKNKGLLGVGVFLLILLTSVVWFPLACALGLFGVIMVVVGDMFERVGNTIMEFLDIQ